MILIVCIIQWESCTHHIDLWLVQEADRCGSSIDASAKLVHDNPSMMGVLRLAGSSKNYVASDVMWSDPVNAPGLRPNDARGCGTVYGPDVTQVRALEISAPLLDVCFSAQHC
jgi:hypothetical protein